jgi:hypothetical protein
MLNDFVINGDQAEPQKRHWTIPHPVRRLVAVSVGFN